MILKLNYKFILEIIIGVYIANLLSNFRFIKLFHHIYLKYKLIQKRNYAYKKYTNFYDNRITVNPDELNMLILCHGRNTGLLIEKNLDNDESQSTDVDFNICKKCWYTIKNINNEDLSSFVNIDFSKYKSITIDINPKTNPHIIGDALDFKNYNNFPNSSFNIIIIFNCECHTKEINESPILIEKLKPLLKKDGFLLIKSEEIKNVKENGFLRHGYTHIFNNEINKINPDESSSIIQLLVYKIDNTSLST